MRNDVHLQSGNISVYCLWLLLDVSAVSVVIVICDMPRQEFSLHERVYIHNMYYMKSRMSCSEKRRKFRVKFPGGPVPNPRTIRRQAERFKETGSVKNKTVNRRHHVLTEEMASRNKQTEIHPSPKLQGGVAVDTDFVHCYKYSKVDLQIIVCIRRHGTLVYPIYPPLFAFQSEHNLEASCLLTLLVWARRWGEHCFCLFQEAIYESACTKSNKITEITYTYCEYTHFTQWEFLARHVTNRNNHNQ